MTKNNNNNQIIKTYLNFEKRLCCKFVNIRTQWHALGREEQAKYYELARRERQLHMQMYPDWSSRTNASRGKKRKRKQDSSDGGSYC